ncbi:MAG: hypothetical protein M1818_007604 [Claussenomyces sp. TS43310]|nr:MAG: hypothetical protein M1818_007604 [Claussenomyces sp. TS43310]
MSMPPWGALPPPPTVQGVYGMPTGSSASRLKQPPTSRSLHWTLNTDDNSASPAYTAVPAPRRTFDYVQTPPASHYSQPLPPPPGLSAIKTPAKKNGIEWPQSVRNYVQRSFDPSNVMADVAKLDMENKLKEIISAATDNGSLNTIDWDTLPLPQEIIRSERAQTMWQQQSQSLRSGEWGNSQLPHAPESKKRKSEEMHLRPEEDQPSSPPWRNTNNRNAFESRITQPTTTARAGKRQTLGDEAPLKSSSKFQKSLEKRQKKFDGGYVSTYRSPSPEHGSGPVVGRCEVLEKRYLRLTAAPNPDLVRPLHILKQTLDLLKKKWRKEGNYSYICDQFKSLRQDLTVQHIKDKFTVEVYEIHARIALEKADLGEYNQCQTQLRALYAQNLGGNPVEFKAYRILYFIHTCNRTALNDVLADLTIAEKEEAPIKHALDVRSALALGNYHKFFRLYLETPNMGAYLMDIYKPAVTLRFITEELGFESDADAAQFICDHNGTELLEEKGDGIQLLTGKAGQIFETAKAAAFRKVDIKGQI